LRDQAPDVAARCRVGYDPDNNLAGGNGADSRLSIKSKWLQIGVLGILTPKFVAGLLVLDECRRVIPAAAC
jgi:hypothetical protein